VLLSAFDSAGQRCSALRLLCLQDEIADHILTMLKGAMAELATVNPDKLRVDVGPVITLSAQRSILDYVQKMQDRQCGVHQSQTLAETAEGILCRRRSSRYRRRPSLRTRCWAGLACRSIQAGGTGCSDRRH
jgi:delta 1-pyrroline-5-carboxylate dehydrogenase